MPLLFLAHALCWVSCAGGWPRESMLGALHHARRAAELEAHLYAPSLWEQMHLIWEAASQEAQRQRTRVLPRYQRADSLYRAAQRVAQAACSLAVERRLEEQVRAEEMGKELSGELETWRQAVTRVLPLREAREALALATLAWERGRVLLERGCVREASCSFSEAREALGTLATLLREHGEHLRANESSWRAWVEETVRESRNTGGVALIVNKYAHTLYVLRNGQIIARYPCDLGYNSALQKLQAGDGATPEGRYRVTAVVRTGSKYYKALKLDYPTGADRARFAKAVREGIIPQTAHIGGHIEIHGGGGLGKDWTDGCVALADEHMDQLVDVVTVGTPVTIVRWVDWP